jgi:4-diphosphocytidyl-2-C-methyl-D-erythritol kinase
VSVNGPQSVPRSVTVRAPAKVNLFLGVGSVGADGYHPLDTVYQAVSLYDDVTVIESVVWSVTVEPIGDIDCDGVPLDSSNIVVRAGELLTAHHRITRRAAIAINKGIPVAGGMAGGSADAAATLVALDRLWDLQTTDDDLLALAAELGSDVPFALIGGTAHGTGNGELVEPVSDEGSWWWVVIPSDVGLSTAAVYAEFDRLDGDRTPPAGRSSAVLAALGGRDVAGLAASLGNDLQAAALSLRPDLERTFEDARSAGATDVVVSGSGPTVLTLIGDQETALVVRQDLMDQGYRVVLVATGPVAGAHVVEYA